MLVTTVSYPVMQDEELMGVAAVSIPVTELAQLAHTANVRHICGTLNDCRGKK